MRTRARIRALTGFAAALVVVLPSIAAADTVGPPYIAAGGAGTCSDGTQTFLMECDADGSAEVSGAVELSASTETAYEGALPGSGTAMGRADIYTEHTRAAGADSLTYTVHLHVDEASVERSGGILDAGEATVKLWVFAIPEDCLCEGSASVTLASSVDGPAVLDDEDVTIPVTISGGEEGIPAGTTFIQFFFEASARVSLDTGLARADASFTVTHIDVS